MLETTECTPTLNQPDTYTTNMDANTTLINLSGGGPYGFRLMEGPTDLLVVDKVKSEGKAEAGGLKEGDRLLEINGRDCRGMGVDQINSLMEAAGQNLLLKVDRSRGTVPGVRGDSGMTVSAPAGVHVQANQDQSITMTIGMPFDLDGALAGPQQRALEVGAVKRDASSRKQVVTQKANQSSTSCIQKDLQPSSPDTPGASGKKKVYMDSMFYDDATHKYPTVDEQISLARSVALHFLDPLNVNSKGYKMYLRMMKRAAKYTTGATEEELAAANSEESNEPMLPGSNILRPKPHGNGDVGGLPASIVFAPKLPNSADKERLDAMSMEEIERMELSKTKLTHTNVNPQLCFNLADDLKNMKGKGARLFAKRQAKAESWCVGDSDDIPLEAPKPSGEVMQKFTSQWKPEDNPEFQPPVGRLKDMVDESKAKMTPWNAAAQYGTVDKAFEHLDTSKQPASSASVSGKLSKTLAENLEASLVTLRRDQASRSGNDAQKKSVSVDPERLKALGHRPEDIGLNYTSKGKGHPVKENSEADKSSGTGRSSNIGQASLSTGPGSLHGT